MEKVPPYTPFKNFHTKSKKDNHKDTDRRIERAIKMIYVGDDLPGVPQKTNDYRKQNGRFVNRPYNKTMIFIVGATIGRPFSIYRNFL